VKIVNPSERLGKLYSLVGERAVLLPLELGSKAPKENDWQKTTFEQTQKPDYRRDLLGALRRGGNIGVVLGTASGNLCAIDIDTDDEIEPFLKLNPKLASSLRTNGANGCQIWIRVVGDYPERVVKSKLKVPGTKKAVAEWRGGGGSQSVIQGKHPTPGKRYRFGVEAVAIETPFDIQWPEHWGMNFDGPKASPEPGPGAQFDAERVGRIWRYVEKVDKAVSGKGGSIPTFRLANVLVWGFGLAVEQARPFMLIYSLRCDPPWSEKEIDHKLEDALTKDHDKPRGHLWGDHSRDSHHILDDLKASAIKGQAFHELKIPSRKKLLDDWFREGDFGFIYSPRGAGKTWLGWGIARAIARGEGFGPWEPGEGPVPVCYLDGEMPAELMQNRDKAFGEPIENLMLINHEILFERTSLVLNLADPETQRAITQLCVDGGVKVLIIDNLSTLASGVKENDADAWELLLPWLLDLRRKKIAVVLIHHAGRSGEMRGTSRREDSAFWIVKLEKDLSYTDRGCSFLATFEKNRNSALNPDSHVWTIKEILDPQDLFSGKLEISFKLASLEILVLDKIREGHSRCNPIAAELGCQPSTVSKAAQKLAAQGKIRIDNRNYILIEENQLEKDLFEQAKKVREEMESRDRHKVGKHGNENP
jgi:hypothetical protein